MEEIQYSAEQIKKDSKDIKWDNHLSISDFYTKHRVFFEKLDNAVDDKSKLFFIDIKLHFLDFLIGKQRYSLSEPILTDVNILLESLKEHNEYDALYEKYLMIYGVIEGKLEKYDSSLQIFKELRKIDPDNDFYKKWYIYNKSNLNSKTLKILTYTGIAIVMIDIFGRLLFDYEMNKKILIIGFILLSTGLIVPYTRKYYTKIKEKI